MSHLNTRFSAAGPHRWLTERCAEWQNAIRIVTPWAHCMRCISWRGRKFTSQYVAHTPDVTAHVHTVTRQMRMGCVHCSFWHDFALLGPIVVSHIPLRSMCCGVANMGAAAATVSASPRTRR